MKKALFFLLSFCTIVFAKAQSNNMDSQAALMGLIEKKHNFEKTSNLEKNSKNAEKISNYKTQYETAYGDIIKNKSKILSFIKTSLESDKKNLSNKFLNYNYKNPLSSYIDPKNVISFLTYYKIVEYSLKNNKDQLPSLLEISKL